MTHAVETGGAVEGPVLDLAAVGKRFGDFPALGGVDLTLHPGRIHCLLGENGAGKSTLCKILYGETPPSEGAMRWLGEDYRPQSPADALAAGIAMVHQHFSLIPTMTVCENLMLGSVHGKLKPREFAQRLVALSERYRLAVDPFRRVDELSVGEQQRVEILKCLMRDPRLVILDEPTAVLLPEEIEALLDTCRQIVAEGRSILLVTHKLSEIARVADEVTVLRGGKRVAHRRFSPDQVDALVSAMVGSDMRAADLQLDGFRQTGDAPAARLGQAMVLDGLSFTAPDGRRCLDNVTLVINGGEILGLAGVEGNGQSELGDILAGLYPPSAGRFYLHDVELTGAAPGAITAAGVGIVPEDRLRVGCIAGLSLTENLLLPSLHRYRRWGLLDRGSMRAAAATLIERFDVRASSPDMAFSNLSGGNQQKAVLARELSLDPLHFLLAAHPTRGLDVGAVFEVYRQIRGAAERGVGVLLISSELDDLIATCDKIAVIYRGRIVGILPAEPAYRERIGAWMAGSEVAA